MMRSADNLGASNTEGPLAGMSKTPPLTSLAKSAGCAAKIAQADLQFALAGLPSHADPRVLIGHDTSDDAAVIRLTDDLALIETVDIFPPVVDDPYDYGRIAAANALSDIYAMGGTPLNALSFFAWPMDTLGAEPLRSILQGAASVCTEAGIVISGGHSIIDEEPKFGLFVTGTVHPQRVVSNSGAQVGDVLVLTKPIGTGVLTTAVKRGALDRDGLAGAIASMTTLNRDAAEAMIEAGVNAATDVTGFGLLGHLGNVLRASSRANGTSLGARLVARDIPVFAGVQDHLDSGLCPGGTRRNLDFAAPYVRFPADSTESEHLLLADAQTSGGLLIAVSESRLAALLDGLARRNVGTRAVIGRVIAADEAGFIDVV